MINPSQPESISRFTVQIDRDLQEIVPVFLANRQNDLQILRRALADHDFKTMQMLGHRMRGDGGGYGFARISEIGSIMERAAARQDHSELELQTIELEEFLARVTVVYR